MKIHKLIAKMRKKNRTQQLVYILQRAYLCCAIQMKIFFI